MKIENPEVIFNSIDNGIIILDENLNITYWNRWLELRTKISSEDIIGQNILEKFDYIKEASFKRKIKSTLSLNTPTFYSVNPHNYLIKIVQHNITNKVFDYMQQSVTIVPYNLEKKEVCLYIYDNTSLSSTNFRLSMVNGELNEYKEDLEKKVELEVRLNKDKDKLLIEQSKLAAMGEMIGAIAHQWRQPLNALAAHTQFLQDDYEDHIIDQEYISKHINKNMELIAFMSNTIDDFRNFYSIDKEKSTFSVKQKIHQTLKISEAGLIKHNIEVNINGDDFFVLGLASEFQQVILNLISNSKDAIVTKKVNQGMITLDIFKKGIIKYTDNGGGVSDHIIDRIFEPYFTTKDQGEGLGIGLYMSKKIIEDNMDGTITAHNYMDGILFRIDLKNSIKKM